MPLYEYQCSECLQVWEEFDSINAKTVTDCLKCGANKANRMVSQVTSGKGFILKGPGWANDGYKK